MGSILLKVPDCFKDSRNSALCIVTSVSGSVPGKIGAKMIVFSDGSIEGTVGGGAIEKQVIEDALGAIRSHATFSREYNLHEDLSMNCGGAVTIYIEALTKPARLLIFGAGHIGKVLARLTPDFGFDTYLIDWRKDIFEEKEHLRFTKIVKPYLEAIKDISFDPATYCVIVTPGHEMDEEVLAAIGKEKTAYTGLIGSKRKIETLYKRFCQENILTEDELKRVDMPIGIKFNAITPEEIAISILAKLIDVKNSESSL
jgi:xanthine dehydrogenase accessory factor